MHRAPKWLAMALAETLYFKTCFQTLDSMGPFVSEPGAVYEVKLVAYNGNGESDCQKRLVSLVEEDMSNPATGKYDQV